MRRRMFAVQRVEWESDLNYDSQSRFEYWPVDVSQRWSRLTTATDVQAVPCSLHLTPADADAECQRLTLLDREERNPFQHINLHDRSPLFLVGLRALGLWTELTPTLDDLNDEWNAWWELLAPTWTAEQRQGVWELSGVVLYRVTEVEFEE